VGQFALALFVLVVAVISLAVICLDLILTSPEHRDSVQRNGLPRHDRVRGWWK